MTTAGLIALCSGETGLPFVVNGGIAVNAHGYARDTAFGDIDDIINLVLANKADLGEEKWRALFTKYGTLELYEKVLRATRS